MGDYDTKVALRRFFSEARDNYVQSNGLLTEAYRMLRGWSYHDH